MEGQFMKDVEQEINMILTKNKKCVPHGDEFCNEKNVEKCLKEVSQEFDYFDVSSMEEPFDLTNHKSMKNILIQLINSSYNLTKLLRDTQKQQADSYDKNSRLFSDFKTLSKNVETLRKELALKDKQLQINKEKTVLDRLENTELKIKINESKKEIKIIQKDIASEKNRHKHELSKVLSESKVLQERFRKNCGDYTSKEGHILDILDSYKKTEEKHLNMIRKLQENNQLLLEEILVLKGEVSEAST